MAERSWFWPVVVAGPAIALIMITNWHPNYWFLMPLIGLLVLFIINSELKLAAPPHDRQQNRR